MMAALWPSVKVSGASGRWEPDEVDAVLDKCRHLPRAARARLVGIYVGLPIRLISLPQPLCAVSTVCAVLEATSTELGPEGVG